MKHNPFVDEGWINDHPLAAIEFKYLLQADDDGPDNFVYILGRQNGDFDMPRHTHNFDQIRFPLVGAMNIGGAHVLPERTMGYFVEGLPYGPQQDPLGKARPGERLQLVLQVGGASGYGFMPMAQRRRATKELAEVGKFDGAHYVHAGGKREWGLNAIWRHVYGSPISYARPRYDSVLIADPENFQWRPERAVPGVARKHLGTFTERMTKVELIRLEEGSTWRMQADGGRMLVVVTEGAGRLPGEAYGSLSAVQLEPGEACEWNAAQATELFAVTLPPLRAA